MLIISVKQELPPIFISYTYFCLYLYIIISMIIVVLSIKSVATCAVKHTTEQNLSLHRFQGVNRNMEDGNEGM